MAAFDERQRRAHRLKPNRHQIVHQGFWRTVTQVGPCSWDPARVEIRTEGQSAFTLFADEPIRSRLVPPSGCSDVWHRNTVLSAPCPECGEQVQLGHVWYETPPETTPNLRS